MAYLGLDLDSLYWEVKALINNNYGGLTKENIEDLFCCAEEDIINSFRDIIRENKEDIIKEVKEGLEE